MKLACASKEFGIVVIHLLQNMRNDDIPEESRFGRNFVFGAILLYERHLPFIKKYRFPMSADQFIALLSDDIRR